MTKCGVCGSENEAAALFCGTCGSPLTPAEAATTVDEAAKTTVTQSATTDESVVPGKGGARRDLPIGGVAKAAPETAPKGRADTEPITDLETVSGGPTITCGVCGTVNDATRTYCRKCANELKPAPAAAPPPPPPAKGRGISPVALGLGAAAAVVAVALVGVLLLGGGTPGATLSPTAQGSGSPLPSEGGVEPSAGVTTEPTPTARTFTEGALSGQIAFTRCPASGACAIYLRPADSSAKAERIIGAPAGSAFDPSLSHDGKRIVYASKPGLRIVTISSGQFVQHSTGLGDTNADWSPDDSRITYSGFRSRDDSGDDPEVRIDGVTTSGSSEPLTLNDVLDHDPVFTPDGRSIVWIQGSGDEGELKLIDIESGDVIDLTTDAFNDLDPAVSPDGTEVAFASKRASGTEYDLFVLDLATLEITALPAMSGDEHDPAWSPGGRYIVFSGGANGSKDLLILDRADNSITPYTTAEGSDLMPSWR